VERNLEPDSERSGGLAGQAEIIDCDIDRDHFPGFLAAEIKRHLTNAACIRGE
jgi:hypothetical protein